MTYIYSLIEEFVCAEDPHFVIPFLICLSIYGFVVPMFELDYYTDIFCSGDVQNYKSFRETFFNRVHLIFLLIFHVALLVGLIAVGAASRLDQVFIPDNTVGGLIVETVAAVLTADVAVNFCGFHLFRWHPKKSVQP